MARKKAHTLTPEQEAAAQRKIDKMSPEELEQMAAFEKEFDKLPEEMQDFMFTFAQRLEKLPAKKREKLFEAFDKFSSLMGELNETDREEDGENDEDECVEAGDPDEYNYVHYLNPADATVQKYTLRVTLKDHKPAIYRKFSVPSNISLRHLSELLIGLMGWDGSHLNQFRKGRDYYMPDYQRGDDCFGSSREYSQETCSLSEILSEKGRTVEWEYDFGDSWIHEVRLSAIDEYKEGEPLVAFIKGERACPPDDCGGIWGYEELLEIRDRWLKYKDHAGRRPSRDDLERLGWYDMDRDFDPEEFDVDFAREICDDFCE